MRLELVTYRARPTDAAGAKLFEVAKPWLTTVAFGTLSRYPRLSASGYLDDVTLEGGLALLKAARRFVYLCSQCGASKVNYADLQKHQVDRHRQRGLPLVQLESYSKQTAYFAMRQVAKQLYYKEYLSDDEDFDPPDTLDLENDTYFRVCVEQVRRRLYARTREELDNILRSGDFELHPHFDWIREEVELILTRL